MRKKLTKTKKIVIVDDDPAILEVIKVILEENQFRVETCQDVQAFNKALQKNNLPDLVLLDLWLDGGDGEPLVRDLKNDPKTKQLPIVIVTARNNPDKIAKEVGAEDFLAKPFDIEDLLSLVRKYT